MLHSTLSQPLNREDGKTGKQRTTAGAMSERHNDLARADIMECAGRALGGDGALAPGVANPVLIY